MIPASAHGVGWLGFLGSPLIVWTIFPSTLLCYQRPLDLPAGFQSAETEATRPLEALAENSDSVTCTAPHGQKNVRASPDSKEERRNVSSEMEKSHCRRAYRMGQIAVTILRNNLPHGQMEKGHEPTCSLRLLLVLSSSESEVQTISLAKWQINPR